jgi:hypothetical protein
LNKTILVLATLAAVSAQAIDINLSMSTCRVLGGQNSPATLLDIDHLQVPGYGVFNVTLQWNPKTLNFDTAMVTQGFATDDNVAHSRGLYTCRMFDASGNDMGVQWADTIDTNGTITASIVTSRYTFVPTSWQSGTSSNGDHYYETVLPSSTPTTTVTTSGINPTDAKVGVTLTIHYVDSGPDAGNVWLKYVPKSGSGLASCYRVSGATTTTETPAPSWTSFVLQH